MFKNIASQKVIFFAFDSTTNLPKTGDGANITPYVSKDYGTVTVLGTATATELDSTNAKGYYSCVLTQAETNADTLMFTAKSSTANIVVIGSPAVVMTNPPLFTTLAVDASGRVDLGKILGTAVSTPATAGILDVNVKNMNNVAGTAITTIKAVQGLTTADTITTCTTVTNQLTAATIASGVWKDTTAGDFTTSASIGKSIMNGVALGTGLTINAYTGNTVQTGDAYARLGAPAGASVSADVAAVNSKTTNLPASPASTTNITSGTITTVTNLTNAPSAGDFTAAMKTSLSAATPTVLLTAGTGTGQVTLSSGVLTANPNGDFTATQKTSIGTAVAASAVASVTAQVSANVTAVNGTTVTGDGGLTVAWGPA